MNDECSFPSFEDRLYPHMYTYIIGNNKCGFSCVRGKLEDAKIHRMHCLYDVYIKIYKIPKTAIHNA